MANYKSKKLVASAVAQNKSDIGTEEGRKLSLSWKLALLLGVISLIVYGNTLKNGFAMDDNVMIVYNKYVSQGVSAIPDLFTTPHQRGFHEIPNDEYRPLPLVMYAILHQFFGMNPVPFHFLNILLFAGGVILLFRFLDQLFYGKKTVVAFLASLLFALHPLHTEVVANIKSGDELLCLFFAFLGLNVFVKYIQSGKTLQILAGFLCVFLSYLSKETVITFLAVIPLVFFFYRDENKKRSTYIVGCMVLATVAFLAIRFSVLNYYHANNMARINIVENALAKEGLSVESRLATAVLILGHYFKLLVIPYPLVSEYSYNTIPFTHFSDYWVLLSLLLYVAIAVIGIWRFIKDRKDPYAFGIFFFLITIALFSNILVMIKATMGERFMFFPSVGFCIVIALLIEKWMLRYDLDSVKMLLRFRFWVVVAPICIIYGAMTIGRNNDWVDNYTLYSCDIKKVPENSHMNYLLGYELFSMSKRENNMVAQKQMIDDAITYMRKSVTILPDYYVLADLGAAYFANGQYDSAEVYDIAALKLVPDAAVSRNNLSGLFIKTKQYRRNIDHCKKTIELVKNDVNAYSELGVSYVHLGKNDSAIYYLKLGMAVDPKYYGCYSVLAYIYKTIGYMDSSAKYQTIAVQLSANPN